MAAAWQPRAGAPEPDEQGDQNRAAQLSRQRRRASSGRSSRRTTVEFRGRIVGPAHGTRPLPQLPRHVRRPGRLEDRARSTPKRRPASCTRQPSSAGLLRRRRASAREFSSARHRTGKRTRTVSGELDRGQARASRIRRIGAAICALELEATTTVDQTRFGMSDGPFRNVGRPTKLRVKTRLVRSESRFDGSGREASRSWRPLRIKSR